MGMTQYMTLDTGQMRSTGVDQSHIFIAWRRRRLHAIQGDTDFALGFCLVKINWLYLCGWFQTLYMVSLMYMYIFSAIIYSSDYCSFRASLDIGYCECSNFVQVERNWQLNNECFVDILNHVKETIFYS